MGMNPDTNRLEPLTPASATALDALKRELGGHAALLRPNGEPVPKHWTVFTAGELVTVKDYTFRVAHMNECTLVLEPVKPSVVLDGEAFDPELARAMREAGT